MCVDIDRMCKKRNSTRNTPVSLWNIHIKEEIEGVVPRKILTNQFDITSECVFTSYSLMILPPFLLFLFSEN